MIARSVNRSPLKSKPERRENFLPTGADVLTVRDTVAPDFPTPKKVKTFGPRRRTRKSTPVSPGRKLPERYPWTERSVNGPTARKDKPAPRRVTEYAPEVGSDESKPMRSDCPCEIFGDSSTQSRIQSHAARHARTLSAERYPRRTFAASLVVIFTQELSLFLDPTYTASVTKPVGPRRK
ncbi:MAG: hypothetical protein RL518_1341 [Pseudomonadota bacterium]|jgi:hypothetical protein